MHNFYVIFHDMYWVHKQNKPFTLDFASSSPKLIRKCPNSKITVHKNGNISNSAKIPSTSQISQKRWSIIR